MRRTGTVAALGAIGALLGACEHDDPALDADNPSVVPPPVYEVPRVATHSGSIALGADGARLFVVHPDADSVSVINARTHAIEREVLLEGVAPGVDPRTHRFDPAVSPRALALSADGATLFVSGERSGRVYAVNVSTGTVSKSTTVCSEPIGVLLAPDGARLYVACSQDDEVVALRTRDLGVESRVHSPRKPWALAWGADGTLVATHLLGPGVSVYGTAPLALRATWNVPDIAAGADARTPHGEVRGIYDAALRPGTSELWVLHMLLGTDTPQPHLDFQRTVFPAITVLDASGQVIKRLVPQVRPGDDGALGDVVSGPRAIAFTPDGRTAYVVDADSEDVLAIDAVHRIETGLVRPLGGHLPEGLALGTDGTLFVQQRTTEDVVRLHTVPGHAPVLDGTAMHSLAHDPMPADLRLGQKLFYSANSDDVPVTENHWVACASCHLEGRSDAVTWGFSQGPRDTPSNGGGMSDTGFLFRTAARTSVNDYWQTMNVEQGGHMSLTAPAHGPLLDALTAYVNRAIPIPVPPRTNAAMVARGHDVFAQVACTRCHYGSALTDSGAGNPTLDLAGVVLLHDVGTCRRDGRFVDVAQPDKAGHTRGACAFDTPALRGLVDSAPYLHDGSEATLDDVVNGPIAHVGAATRALSASDHRALVEYLRSL